MSEIKALGKMRCDLQICKNAHRRPTIEFMELCAYEIEAEIAERYQLLPVDADGVPIHCGDRMRLDNGHEGDVWLIGVFDIMMSDHTCFDWAKSHHVKPRTVEDVLEDFLADYDDWDDGNTLGCDREKMRAEHFEKYADEIRELLGGDAE